MDLYTLILIAIGLSMDALAVSISSGLVIPDVNRSHGLKIGFSFGLFQAVMPIIGWLAGTTLRSYIENIDHWIAFILLGLVGAKMIYEALTDHASGQPLNPLDPKVLLLLSLATSIDAMAIGLSFAILHVPLFPAVLIIGVITFLVSGAGVYLGKRATSFVGKFVEIMGGVILLAIGLKILLEHLQIIP
jgi:manganese efflux pump family protein